jgi:hypothetical protein
VTDVHVLPEQPLVGRRLGRHVEHDPRSRQFAYTATTATLTSARWARHAPVWNQGNLGSCTGNALVGALSCDPFYPTLPGLTATEELAVAVYSDATRVDPFPGEWPPTDTGSSGLAVAKVAQRRGWISAYQHAFDNNAALTALTRGPVIAGINWYSSFDTPGPDGRVVITRAAYVRGGHEVCLDEVDAARSRVWFTNSWGPSWGVHGRAWMSFATFARLLREDGDVTILVPLAKPVVKPPVKKTVAHAGWWTTLWARVRSLLHRT